MSTYDFGFASDVVVTMGYYAFIVPVEVAVAIASAGANGKIFEASSSYEDGRCVYERKKRVSVTIESSPVESEVEILKRKLRKAEADNA